MTPHDYARAVIAQWEGNLSMDPNDPGNWYHGQLFGSMHGVTADTLEAFMHRPVTREDVKSVTLDEAADIAVAHFYHPDLSQLDWSPAVANLLDFEWGSGETQTVKNLQRLCGAAPDGVMGPATVAAFNAWQSAQHPNAARLAVYQMRIDFYKMLGQQPRFAQYVQGWCNRAAWAANAWVVL